MIVEQKIRGRNKKQIIYATRKEEMKATERTGNREGAKRKRAGKSALMMLTHPEPKALYTPSFYWRKKSDINRGSFNNISG